MLLRNPRFALLAVSTAFVGATVGVERSVLALFGAERFGLASRMAIASFLIAFGLTKALSNLAFGPLAARMGPGRVLVAGWGIGALVPIAILAAGSWSWVVAANGLLGISQGLAWSAALVMQIDIAGERRKGFAAGVNEFSGYGAAALGAYAAARLAAGSGVRSAPFLLMGAFALAGLMVSLATLRGGAGAAPAHRSGFGWVFRRVSWSDRRLSALSASGLVTNLSDGLAWALLPIYFVERGLSLGAVGLLTAAYPAAWASLQLAAGWASDRAGRRALVVSGLGLQSASVALLLAVDGFWGFLASMVGLGFGTAAVYPTLVAGVADLTPPGDRPGAIGVYRMWRDLGYVLGAVIAGVFADVLGLAAAIGAVAVLTGLVTLRAWMVLPASRRWEPALPWGEPEPALSDGPRDPVGPASFLPN